MQILFPAPTRNIFLAVLWEYSFMPNCRGRELNKMHQEENYQDFLKRKGRSIFSSFSYNNSINLSNFFPKICNFTPSPPTIRHNKTIFYNLEWAEVRKLIARFFERNFIVKWVISFASFCWLWDFLPKSLKLIDKIQIKGF